MPLPYTYFVKTSTIVGAPSNSNDGRDPLGCALSGATYDHTGGGSGERQLTAASGTPFGGVQAGDYIFLSNVSGGVASGLYEIASVVSTTVILLVADSGLTADGTVNSSNGPWQTLQFAFDSTTGEAEILVICDDGNGSPNWTPSTVTDIDVNAAPFGGILFQGGNSRGVVDGTRPTISGSSLPASTSLINIGALADNRRFADVRFTGATAHNIFETSNGAGGWVFLRCRFDNATSSGIVWETGNTLRLIDCELDHNGTYGIRQDTATATNRGGWYLTRCRIHHNGSDGIQAPAGGSSATSIINCHIYRNGAYGLTIYRQARNISIQDSNFFANTSSGIRFASTSTTAEPPAVIHNCVFRSNGAYAIDMESVLDYFLEVDYCCFHNNTSGTLNTRATITNALGSTNRTDHNIYVDPQFTSETDGSEDFTPASGSPLIDAGISVAIR